MLRYYLYLIFRRHRYSKLNFCLGTVLGFVTAFIHSSYDYTTQNTNVGNLLDKTSNEYTPTPKRNLDLRNATLEKADGAQQMVDNDGYFHQENNTLAKTLSGKVRILCWIMTSPQNLEKKAVHVRNTWSKRCNIVVFFSSTTNTSFPTIGLNVSEGRYHLTEKTMKGFRFVYEHYRDAADWFMKADDDTYVILENLRYFLKDVNPNEPVYYGHHFKQYIKQGYYSGGAGYVLSKEALRRLALQGIDSKICHPKGVAEDYDIGVCMQTLGVKTKNSTDSLGRSRFHCFHPEQHIMGYYLPWYYQYDSNGAKKGIESISDYAISFHYITPEEMYAFEFYFYHLRPYGMP